MLLEALIYSLIVLVPTVGLYGADAIDLIRGDQVMILLLITCITTGLALAVPVIKFLRSY